MLTMNETVRLVLTYYLMIMTIVGFLIMGIDKSKAVKKEWRISEKVLFLIQILGGAIGGTIGMYTFRHKTKHRQFIIGFPMIALVWIAVLFVLGFFNV